jgi:dienelactone hydrolase
VAVLRFDEVTHAHPEEVAGKTGFTLTDEYVPHAVAAIQLLARHPAVDAGRVFVAGHSLGGTVAPRVAAAEPLVAGLVIMAGDHLFFPGSGRSSAAEYEPAQHVDPEVITCVADWFTTFGRRS